MNGGVISSESLRRAEQCPCGARPETPDTHPHVLGCPNAVIDESRERAERIQSDHHLADLARAYCAARHALKGVSYASLETAVMEVDRAYYEMMKACGYFEVDE